MPGLVLALARPDRRWVLVDSVRKKADVLRGFVASLGIANVEVVAERAEILGRDPAHRERHDVVAARACAALPVLAEYALPLLALGGTLVAWKGPIADDELRCRARGGGRLWRARAIGPSVGIRRAGRSPLRRDREGPADAASATRAGPASRGAVRSGSGPAGPRAIG